MNKSLTLTCRHTLSQAQVLTWILVIAFLVTMTSLLIHENLSVTISSATPSPLAPGSPNVDSVQYKHIKRIKRPSESQGESIPYEYIENEQQNIFFPSNNLSCLSNRTVVATIGYYSHLSEMIVSNHFQYSQKHGYDYFILRRRLHNYNRKSKYGTMQRALLIWNLLYNASFETNNINFTYTYTHVIWIDFDAIFLNDSITVGNMIDFASEMISNTSVLSMMMGKSSYESDTRDISLIVSGDWTHVINAGVLIFQKNEVTEYILKQWLRILGVCQYYPHYRSIMQYDSENMPTKNESCQLTDQLGLVLILFDETLNVSKALNLIQELELLHVQSSDHDKKENAKDKYLIDSSAVSIIFDTFGKYILHNGTNLKRSRSKQSQLMQNCSGIRNFYDKRAVIREQCLTIGNELSKMFVNHVGWIEQSKFNANIWSQYRVDASRLLYPWVLHLAGQSQKIPLLKLFVDYKQVMNNQSVTQDVKKFETQKVERLVNRYVTSKARNWKVRQLIKANTTYDNYIRMRNDFTDQKCKH